MCVRVSSEHMIIRIFPSTAAATAAGWVGSQTAGADPAAATRAAAGQPHPADTAHADRRQGTSQRRIFLVPSGKLADFIYRTANLIKPCISVAKTSSDHKSIVSLVDMSLPLACCVVQATKKLQAHPACFQSRILEIKCVSDHTVQDACRATTKITIGKERWR